MEAVFMEPKQASLALEQIDMITSMMIFNTLFYKQINTRAVPIKRQFDAISSQTERLK